MKNKKVLFLYGRIGKRNKAVYYCNLHKCFLMKSHVWEKKFN